jgi:deoxycytidylate deaminase
MPPFQGKMNQMIKKTVKSRASEVAKAVNGTVSSPELFFGIVGPIGVDIDAVVENLKDQLERVNYKSSIIHLTKYLGIQPDNSSYFARYTSLIKGGNAVRLKAQDNAAMAALGIGAIRDAREKTSGSKDKPAHGQAYIVRQFKRPEEIHLMRKVYGRKFIQLSVYGGEIQRKNVLIRKIKAFDDSPKDDSDCEKKAIDLIKMDHMQADEVHGQSISDVFYLGDAFVDGVNIERTRETIERFVCAFFGDNRISPSKDEYGLYMASAASLRSIDLSRQVGAAIFSKEGEIISLGCNEVPKAGGGTYWSDDPGTKMRDMEVGHDPNHVRRNEIIFDLVERLSNEGLLSREILKQKSASKMVQIITSKKSISDSQIMDIIEYNRVIHAEMSAITDAARMGRSTRGSTLFCTTFPCHICAKHIVSAGLSRVVFLEPYPKSQAYKLHSDSITFDENDTTRVVFSPFIGISPRRYRDIFEKKKRKDKTGRSVRWHHGHASPMIDDRGSAHIENEKDFLSVTVRKLFGRYQSPRATQRARKIPPAST